MWSWGEGVGGASTLDLTWSRCSHGRLWGKVMGKLSPCRW